LPTPSPTKTATPSPSPSLVVTLAANGTTLRLAVGERFLLDLGGNVTWTVTVANPQVVTRLQGIPVPSGDQGVFVALAPGTTILTAVGSPPCASGICPLFRLGFRVTITVA
jgi:hypothetical protein